RPYSPAVTPSSGCVSVCAGRRQAIANRKKVARSWRMLLFENRGASGDDDTRQRDALTGAPQPAPEPRPYGAGFAAFHARSVSYGFAHSRRATTTVMSSAAGAPRVNSFTAASMASTISAAGRL